MILLSNIKALNYTLERLQNKKAQNLTFRAKVAELPRLSNHFMEDYAVAKRILNYFENDMKTAC